MMKFSRTLSFFCFILFSFQVSAANRDDFTELAGVLKSAIEVNQEIAGYGDDTAGELKLKELIKKRNIHFQTILLMVRSSVDDYEETAVNKKEIAFLSSKININKSRGNLLAAQRDQYLIDTYLIKQKARNFVKFLSNASKFYKPEKEVLDEAKKLLVEIEKKRNALKAPAVREGAIYEAALENYQTLLQVYSVLIDFINYVLDHPEEIVVTSFLQKISVISAISYVNHIGLFEEVNYLISPLRIDMGGVLVSIGIFLLTMAAFPLVSRTSLYLIERFILADGKVESIEAILLSTRKPILYLIGFWGIDLATNALLYKTTFKVSVDQLGFLVYTGLYVYLLFNLIDSVTSARFEQIDKRNQEYSKELVLLFSQVLRMLIFLLALTLGLSHFGINVTAIVSTLGIGGLAFAMAAKDSLANFFGGLNIMIDGIFKMGDWIKVDNVEGTVVEIGLRSTTVRTFDNALITMPNSLVSTASVLNWSRRAVGRRIKMHVGVTYESNMQDIRKALEDIRIMLAEHPDIASAHHDNLKKRSMKGKHRFLSHADLQGVKATQLVFLDKYNDFSIDILIYCFSKTVDWAEWLEVKEDVLFKISDILEANNLSFAYPTNVQINRDDEQTQSESNHSLLVE